MKFSAWLLLTALCVIPSLLQSMPWHQVNLFPSCNSPSSTPNEPPIHVAVVIEADTGAVGVESHAHMSHQLSCALKERHIKVQMDAWKADVQKKICKTFRNDDVTENIRSAAADMTSPPKDRTLCGILETLRKCAFEYDGEEKLHIVLGLLFHDTLGTCNIEEILQLQNFHLTVFWVHGHRRPPDLDNPSIDTTNVDFAIIETLLHFEPKENWIFHEDSLQQLHQAHNVAVNNPVLGSLYIRLKRMSDESQLISTTNTWWKRTKSIAQKPQDETMEEDDSGFIYNLMMALLSMFPIKQPSTNALLDLTSKPKHLGNGSFDHGKVQRWVRTKSLVGKGPQTTEPSMLNSSTTTSVENATDPNSTTSNLSSTRPLSNLSDVSTTSATFISTTLPKCNKTSTTFLEDVGYIFGDCDSGLWIILASILIIVIISCAIALCVYCMCKKRRRGKYQVKPKKDQKPQKPEVVAVAPVETLKNGKANSGEKQHLLQSSSAKNNSNEKVSKKQMNSCDVIKEKNKSPMKPNLKKSPKEPDHEPSQEQSKNPKVVPSKSSEASQSPQLSVVEPESYRAIAVDVPIQSPIGLTPARSVRSNTDEPKMKFNDGNGVNGNIPELHL